MSESKFKARWWRIAAVFFILAGLVAGCSEEQPEEKAKKEQTAIVLPEEPTLTSVLPQKARELLMNTAGIVIVDIRTPAEREQVRIANSITAPFGEILGGRADLPRDRPLMLVCSVGGRSYVAGLYLMKQGFRQVYNLRGGIAAWEKAGFPLEYKESKESRPQPETN